MLYSINSCRDCLLSVIVLFLLYICASVGWILLILCKWSDPGGVSGAGFSMPVGVSSLSALVVPFKFLPEVTGMGALLAVSAAREQCPSLALPACWSWHSRRVLHGSQLGFLT